MSMKICFIPIDNRPVCYSLAKDIVAIDDAIELYLPPRELLGGLKHNADVENLFIWLKDCPKVDVVILSLDTIAYGGLIPSRRSVESFEQIKSRIEKLKTILLEKDAKIFAFSSIMRISNNNYNEEEKEYWKEYGKKIFAYSFSGGKNNDGIPEEILQDYISTRKRNFEINKIYLECQKEGFFDTLIFSKDDCAEFGFNVDEANELEKLGGKIKTGADEIPLSLLSRAVEKKVKIYVEYSEPEFTDLISNYEDLSIKNSVLGQLELGGFEVVDSVENSDVVLYVNNFKEKQGELVMGWDTESFCGKFLAPAKPFCVADVRFANGADNAFVEQLLPQINMQKFYGYSGWNTSANTLGSLLAGVKIRFGAEKYNEASFRKLQIIRFLDDWAYQANVRGLISEPCDVKGLIKPYEDRIISVFGFESSLDLKYSYPWDRKFEIEIVL